MPSVEQIIYKIAACLTIVQAYAGFFCYLRNHRTFYQFRRWKAAFWLASIAVYLLPVMVFLYAGWKLHFELLSHPEQLKSLTTSFAARRFLLTLLNFFSLLVSLSPFHFMILVAAHHSVKWRFNDDLLEIYWKDPNRKKRSPIEWL
jgi:hypothetical protein